MVSAAYRDGRYFDCLKDIEAQPNFLSETSIIARDLYRIALNAYIQTRQINQAIVMVEKCLSLDSNLPDLLLKKASLLGLQANYNEAAKILLHLNRELPNCPAILKRLVLVFEQMRDIGKASAFLRAYAKNDPEDLWAKRKQENFIAIGFYY